MKLNGKVALVTGGAKGIGLGCARVFARHGAIVVLADRDAKTGEASASEIRDAGGAAAFQKCDVTLEADVVQAVDSAVARFGRLDCVVNNAGWHPPATTIDAMSVADFESQLRLNLTSTFMFCKFAAPHLRQTRGSIVIMSSATANLGQTQAASYASSKAGQLGLMRSLALDFARDGVRVNAVCPSCVMTPLMREWADTLDDPKGALAMLERYQPIGRMADIDEIGEVCAFLASNEASFITGQYINADGGAGLGYGDKVGS